MNSYLIRYFIPIHITTISDIISKCITCTIILKFNQSISIIELEKLPGLRALDKDSLASDVCFEISIKIFIQKQHYILCEPDKLCLHIRKLFSIKPISNTMHDLF